MTDGTIYWKELSVSAKTKPKSKLFFTSLFNVNENTDIEFNLQQSEYNYDLLGIGEIKLNYHF